MENRLCEGDRDLLTLSVSDAYREQPEDRAIALVGREGTLILNGVIAGGDIVRFIPT